MANHFAGAVAGSTASIFTSSISIQSFPLPLKATPAPMTAASFGTLATAMYASNPSFP